MIICQQDMDLFTFINKIGGASFATLLVIILWGSWRQIWIWGRDKTELEARLIAEKTLLASDRDFWREIAMKATGIAEIQGRVLRVKEEAATRVENANKRLLPPGGG